MTPKTKRKPKAPGDNGAAVLRRCLAVKGMSQSDVAKLLGISKSTVSRVLAGTLALPLPAFKAAHYWLMLRKAPMDVDTRDLLTAVVKGWLGYSPDAQAARRKGKT